VQSGVIESAQTLARSFRDAASQLQGASQAADAKLRDTVDNINSLAVQIRDLNVRRGQGSQQDPGLDAQMYSALEQLSGLVGIKASVQADSSVTVQMDGGVPLVVGDKQYDIDLQSVRPAGAAYPDGPSDAAILDSSGRDVTAQISTGELAGELHVRNEVIGGLLGDGSRQGDLNTLAEKLAGRINGLLAGGLTSAGAAPAQALFTYDAVNGTNVAATLAATGTTALAAADPGPPWTGNGVALKIAALGTPSAPQDTVDGKSGFVAYCAGITTRVGRDLSRARDNQSLETESVAQARNMRAQLSGVSLDEEAVTLMQYQRAYQAAARLITVLDSLTEATIAILQ
jgi:flagellar hook-associated protein 1 FlgK